MPRNNRLSLNIRDLSFTYASMPDPLFANVSLDISTGWTGLIGVNGAGKTTFLLLVAGLLQPDNGAISRPGSVRYCPQRTDSPPEDFSNLLNDHTGIARELIGRFGIRPDWIKRWDSLSHGERKKAQIASALWSAPDLLALDEPTNHLDHQTREAVRSALRIFDGIGLLISHDRALLDDLCFQCVLINPPDCILRPGGVTKAIEISRKENSFQKERREKLGKELDRLQQELNRRKKKTEEDARKSSKAGLSRGDSDHKAKINHAILTGKDAVSGRLYGRMRERVDRVRKELTSVRYDREKDIGIWLETGFSRKNRLYSSASSSVTLGGGPTLSVPALDIGPRDRIALTGPNGCGKSSLLRRIVPDLNLDADRILYIPQEITTVESRNLMHRTRRLPHGLLGRLMIIIDCLGSEPERLLRSELPSPGETRKLLLAMGILGEPHILVLDEPTNHMDLSSIVCLEEALSDCPCALLLVSHEIPFLDRLANLQWSITASGVSYGLKTGFWKHS
jgi:ATPase subunit of ABC transporter with duplicated ATPase domains